MPQNEMAGSITFGQKKYLKRLIDERDQCEETWFNDLKQGRTEYDSLSAAQASNFIQALAPRTDRDDQSSTDAHASEETEKRTPGPATAKQLQTIRQMMIDKSLVMDGFIDIEVLLARLTTSTASKLIETVQYIPRPETAQ